MYIKGKFIKTPKSFEFQLFSITINKLFNESLGNNLYHIIVITICNFAIHIIFKTKLNDNIN